MPINLDELNGAMTVEEVAHRLDRHPTTIRRWITLGRLDYIREGAGPRGRILITRRMLADYLNRHHARAAPPPPTTRTAAPTPTGRGVQGGVQGKRGGAA